MPPAPSWPASRRSWRARCARAFVAVRPPGHHALPAVPGGFCLLNSVAVGALHAQAKYELDRVAIVDFDVHHGQGTQGIVEADARLFYASSHQYPLYPGTGFARERGIDGNVVNVPLPPAAAASCSAPPGASASCRSSSASRRSC